MNQAQRDISSPCNAGHETGWCTPAIDEKMKDLTERRTQLAALLQKSRRIFWSAASFSLLASALAISDAIASPPERIVRGGFEGPGEIQTSVIGEGTTITHINTARHRESAIRSFGDQQYVAYYSPAGEVTLALRRHADQTWEVGGLGLFGDVTDPHNVISMGIDACGFIHVAWGMHNVPLNYVRSLDTQELAFGGPEQMTGARETRVTYPQFFLLPTGEFIFLYRDGASGRGDLVLNRYDCSTETWTQVHAPLIAGEGERNAYWQAATGPDGSLQISWTWREGFNGVYSNRDLGYARSDDGGMTWTKSDGTAQELPITSDNAEYAARLPLGTGIMNQTSMTVMSDGTPVIAGLWLDDQEVAQYHFVFRTDSGWGTEQISWGRSKTGINSLTRPLVLSKADDTLVFFFRDHELGNRAWMEKYTWPELQLEESTPLGADSVGAWAPQVDIRRFHTSGVISLFYQIQDGYLPESDGTSDVSVLDFAT